MLSSEDLRCAVPKATKLKARHILQAGDTKKQQKSSFSVFERVFTVRFSRLIAQNDRTSLLNPATSLYFRFFVFPGFFGRLKIGEIFVFPKKIAGIQKSKRHQRDPRDHITQNTLTTPDSLDVRETPSEVRNELVHSSGRMIAQIVQHENLRCF